MFQFSRDKSLQLTSRKQMEMIQWLLRRDDSLILINNSWSGTLQIHFQNQIPIRDTDEEVSEFDLGE